MRPPFEVWAPKQIERLRTEADTLQRTLESYLALAGADAASSAASSVAVPTGQTQKRNASGKDGGRPIKHNRLLDFIDEAGPGGLTTDQVAAAADAAGHSINRNSLRSFLWSQRQAGRLISRNGRNISVKFENTGELEGSPSNSPDLLEGAV